MKCVSERISKLKELSTKIELLVSELEEIQTSVNSLLNFELLTEQRNIETKEKYKYPYDDIQRLVGYSFNVSCVESDIMPINELISYLKDGWVIYRECGKNNDDMKILSLVNLNHLE